MVVLVGAAAALITVIAAVALPVEVTAALAEPVGVLILVLTITTVLPVLLGLEQGLLQVQAPLLIPVILILLAPPVPQSF
jgi:hypothetical protein